MAWQGFKLCNLCNRRLKHILGAVCFPNNQQLLCLVLLLTFQIFCKSTHFSLHAKLVCGGDVFHASSLKGSFSSCQLSHATSVEYILKAVEVLKAMYDVSYRPSQHSKRLSQVQPQPTTPHSYTQLLGSSACEPIPSTSNQCKRPVAHNWWYAPLD